MKTVLLAALTSAAHAGQCCWNGCDAAPDGCNAQGDWCSGSAGNCASCGGGWCDGSGPSPAPSPVPSGPALIAFGSGGIAELYGASSLDGVSSLPKTRGLSSNQGAWVTEVDSGLAILSGDGGSKITLWRGGSDFQDVDLGGMVTPVGATYADGMLYVACFGSWPDPAGDSGLAIVDVASGSLISTHAFSDSRLHIHNVYSFNVQGRTEIFVAVLGNPWTGPVAGKGLSRFEPSTGSFALDTTNEDLNVRSAKQQDDGSIFVVTQEPNSQQTKLARLEADGSNLKVVAKTELPALASGNGGADIVLGRDRDTIWVTDRQSGEAGKLYYYTYSSGAFNMVNVRDTGVVPRYTVMLDNGDIVSCNQDGGDLSYYIGLGLSPEDTSITEQRINTVNGPMFFIQTSVFAGQGVLV